MQSNAYTMCILQICPDGEHMLIRSYFSARKRSRRVRIPDEIRAGLFRIDGDPDTKGISRRFPVTARALLLEDGACDIRALTDWTLLT